MLLLTSCSAQWHLKKAVAKDPMILQKDTMVVLDTVVTQPVAITDTVTLKEHDTITVIKDKLRVEVVRKLDTIIINAECASDTIVQTIEVPYEKVVYVEKPSFTDKLKSLLLYILLALVIIKMIQKYFKW